MSVNIVESGWWETLDPPQPAPEVNGELNFDAVVVGGGFTGLACARRLAELQPDARIALIEADRIGRTNSGRNTGYLIDLSFFAANVPKHQARLTRLQTAGLDLLRAQVSQYNIDCDWNEVGYLRGAISDVEAETLQGFREKYLAMGLEPEMLSAEQMNRVMGSQAYQIGMRQGRTTLVQPSKLVCGLAAHLPDNVSVFEMSPVIGITRDAVRHILQIEHGSVSALSVYLCCNGGTPALGYAKNQQVEIATFAAVTPVLNDSHGAIGTVPEFGYLPSILGAPTIRKTPDNRLLIREHLAFTPKRGASLGEYEEFLEIARKSMCIRWQELVDVPFEYAWHGVMPMTRNGARTFGQFGKNLYVSAFCNGAGNTSGTAAGVALAELGAGENTPLLQDQLAMPQANWVPPNWVLKPFVAHEISASGKRWNRAYEALVSK